MLSPKEAQTLVLETVKPIDVVEVGLRDALGLAPAVDLISQDDIPPFNNSAMDGYAVRAEDVAEAAADNPVVLDVIDNIKAGDISATQVAPGTAARIMTGAQIPEGADTVIRVEDTTADGDGERAAFKVAGGTSAPLKPVKILKGAPKGANIRLAGEDIKTGDLAVEKGRQIGPAEIGVLASLGFARVKVFRPVKVAVITTGDELLDVNDSLKPGKIRNSNTYSLAAQITMAGAVPLRTGVSGDTRGQIRQTLEEACSDADIVLTTGGISVGEYDIVKEVLNDIGARKIFWKVAQKPGHPLGLWKAPGGACVFGLPGNPVAVMVCFEEYVRPAIRKMMGKKLLFRPEVKAVLRDDLRKRAGRVHFIRVAVAEEDGCYYAASTGPQGSGVLTSMMLANGLAVMAADTEFMRAGETVLTRLTTRPEDH